MSMRPEHTTNTAFSHTAFRIVSAALFILLFGFHSPSSARQVPSERTREQRQQDALIVPKHDYRLFFGLDDPVHDSGDQSVRRMDFLDELVKVILHYRGIDTSDPTAGKMGAIQHATAAVFAVTDLGTLLRTKCPPRDLDGNYYGQLTRSYEAELRKLVLIAPGQSKPADVMRMALDVTRGNYTLAGLTAHNFLKNVAYIGRQADELSAENNRSDPNYIREQLRFNPGDEYVVLVAAKLENLRANPAVREKMGPWYHIFGILFLGSVTNGIFSEGLTAAEHFTRIFGLGSDTDNEKALWDFVGFSTMEAVHPVLYGNGTLVVVTYDSVSAEYVPWVKVSARVEGAEGPEVGITPAELTRLAPGKYTILAIAERNPDYAPAEKKGVEVKAGERNDIRIDLVSKMGYIQATAVEMETGNPIKDENTYVGYKDAAGMPGPILPTPHTFKVPAGEYRVLGGSIDKKYTVEETSPVTVVPGKLITLDIPLRRIPAPDSRNGKLIVYVKTKIGQDDASIASMATVTISAEINGSRRIFSNIQPDVAIDIPAGRYDVEATSQGFNRGLSKNVEVREGELASVTIYLTNETGILTVTVVDAKNGWTLPGMKVTLKSGEWSYPDVAPCSITLHPGVFDLVVSKATVNGIEYREKMVSGVVVIKDRTKPLLVAVEPVESTPTSINVPAVAAAGALTIEPEFLDLEVGETGRLQARIVDPAGRVIPGASPTWTASAPSVIRVDPSGKVTAIAAGKGTVMAEYRGLTASVSVAVRELPPMQVVLKADWAAVLDGDSVGIDARVPGHDAAALQFRWSTTGGIIAGSGNRVELNTAGVNPGAGDLPISVVVKAVVINAYGGLAAGQTVITVNARKRLSAELSCGASLELVPGEIDRTCGVVVRGWRGNTTDRVEVIFPQLQEDGESLPGSIVVFPGKGSADPANMFTAGATDLHAQYEFSFRFSARSGAPRGSQPIRIIVRQQGATDVRLALTVNVLTAGQIAVPGIGNAPPARQGSGGDICVWRTKLLSETDAGCWQFVAAKCGTARYTNPSNGYILAGTNMTQKEGDDLITEQSRYFSPCDKAQGEGGASPASPLQKCRDQANQIRQLLADCDATKARRLANEYYGSRCDGVLSAAGEASTDLRALLGEKEDAIRQTEESLGHAQAAADAFDYEKAIQIASQAQGGAPACLIRRIQDLVAQMQKQQNASRQREQDALRDSLAQWQKSLDCLEEGKRKSPNSWLDCNGNWTMGSRDVAIDNLRKLIAQARAKLGLPPLVPSVPAQSQGVPITRPSLGIPGAGAPPGGSNSVSPGVLVLQFLHFYGNELWFTPPMGAERPLAGRDSPSPGSALRTGNGSQVSLGSQQGSTITVEQNSNIKITRGAPQPARSIELLSGSVEVKHPEGNPNFDDVILTTPEGKITPTGTRYRVQADNSGTTVEVLEGRVHLSGHSILRLSTPGRDAGKPSPASEIDLRAGERALMVKVSPPSKDPGAASDLPVWMRGKNAAAPTAAPPLYPAEPWNDAGIQQLMDRWIASAVPPSPSPSIIMHYNEWLQPLSQAAVSTGRPDHPADWTRYRYVWENRSRYPSTNLCTLGEFLDRSLRGESLESCKKVLPSWMTAPAQPQPSGKPPQTAIEAIERAHVQVAREEEDRIRQAQSRGAPPPPKDPGMMPRTQPPVAPPDTVRRAVPGPAPPSNQRAAAADFSGSWDCKFRISEVRGGARPDLTSWRTGTESTANVTIRKNGAGYQVTDGQSSIASSYVQGDRIGFRSDVNLAFGQKTNEVLKVGVDLQLTGKLLVGAGEFSASDGIQVNFSLTCSPATKK